MQTLEELRAQGFSVEPSGERALVLLPDSASSFVLLHAGEWVQVATCVLEETELDDDTARPALNEFLLRVHARYLGCRFAYDEDGSLVMATDIYPENLAADHLANVVIQMDFVVSALLPLIRSTQSSKKVPSESELDRAFERS